MAESSSFFNSVNGDRKYKADAFARYFAKFIGNGVFPNPSTGLQIEAGTGMNVTEHSGDGFINGYTYGNDADLSLTVDIADGVLSRKDNIVLRWDLAARSITAQVVKGISASSPAAPALVRTAEQYDLKLAEIYISAGVTSITQSMISDTRLDSTVCGIVTQMIKTIDTTTLFSQLQAYTAEYEAQFNNYFTLYRQQIADQYTLYLNQLSENETAVTSKYDLFASFIDAYQNKAKSDFETWFNEIKGLLGTDEAGNLTNEIAALTTRITTLETTLSNNLLFSAKAWLGNSYSGCAYLSES
jgi:hypothetical protein